ncbi:rhodopsin, GQ-coupled-like [Actinia tenebrosa]|uniref:Rhodopsin, GQ-coupled-like n=1 Tax=Actinia tenebrosa TaxID=6105 RepID=A0A6P8HSE5_ACTTE|nr:rhodopsin, GQ-coupled-like [Actinia tenebrosa]
MDGNLSTAPTIDPLAVTARYEWQVIVETLISILIAFFSISGNTLVFLAVYRDASLRTVPNAFIISLAITDFLFATTRQPMFIHTLLVGHWDFSDAVCQFQGFQGYNLFAATLFTLSAISISRFCLIVYPLHYKSIFSKKSVPRVIACIWVFSVLLCIGPLFGWGEYKFDTQGSICTFDHKSSKSYHILTNTIVQVNVVILIFCYVMIFRTVRAHQRRIRLQETIENGLTIENEANSPENQHPNEHSHEHFKREEIYITRTLLIVVCLFGMCWLPTAILSNLESANVNLPRWVRLLETMSIGMNSMVNPLVYGIRSPKFRRAFLQALRCQ